MRFQSASWFQEEYSGKRRKSYNTGGNLLRRRSTQASVTEGILAMQDKAKDKVAVVVVVAVAVAFW